MRRLATTGFVILAVLLLALLALFPLLTLDTLRALIARVALLEAGNFMLLFYLETARLCTTVVALVAAAVLVMRTAHTAEGRALALFLIFAALTYEKLFAGSVYPGPFQERLTIMLLDAGVSRAMLTWLFGTTLWSLWLALAAALRFSVVFPRDVTPAAIDLSGTHDRRGMLRGAAAAGLDIGALFRGLAKNALQSGALGAVPVWLVAIVVAIGATYASESIRTVTTAVLATLVAGVVITNVRASYAVGNEPERARIRLLVLGFSLGGALFLVASLPALFFSAPLATVPALLLLMLAPATLMVCLALSVLYHGSFDTERLLRLLPELAAFALTLLLVFAAATTLLLQLATPIGFGRPLAVLGALLVTAVLLQPLRQVTQRTVNRVLERPQAGILS
jgi:hypothetical protein